MKLLLTSVCRPLGPRYGDAESVGYELLHGQVTRAQGIFSPRCPTHHFSLEYIAHNLDTPTVVMQYPSKKEFIEEIKQGYDYVGISFVLSTYHRMKEMSELVRRYAPQTKIIMGGYGAVLSDEELLRYGDEICREEGVVFMRRLLGEPFKPLPYDHPLIVNGLNLFSIPIGNNGMVFGGLGCPNGCDFCCTSHFYKRKHIRFLEEGDDIFELVQRYRKFQPDIKFTVLDEDFLLNQKRARRFLELVRQSGEPPPSMFVFASIKALSMYTMEELLEIGVTGLWIGYEGTRSGYSKQQGRDVNELFKDLRDHGIQILASMIIGFDYQTPEVIREELKGLMALDPTFSQILIYGPTPGTPFYERIMEEDRLIPALVENREQYYHDCTGFYGMVKHPTMTSEEIEGMQRECFTTDFKTLGPSIIRGIENWLIGYKRLVNSDNKLLRQRAQMHKTDILNSVPVFLAASVLGPSKMARKRARAIYLDIARTFKVRTPLNFLKSSVMLVMACWTSLCLKMHWFQEPKLVRLQFQGKAETPRPLKPKSPKREPELAGV